jgi:redox-sensitive bicupin YhaK (pirin superfamily)
LWRTFGAGSEDDPLASGFGILQVLDETSLRPGASLRREPGRTGEVITYVQQGALSYQESSGRLGIIEAGEIQYMTAKEPARFMNCSPSHVSRVFQIWLRAPIDPLEPRLEQRVFSAAERRGGLSPLLSPDARTRSLRGQQDVGLYSALLDPGQHVVHHLGGKRQAWIHVVQGQLDLRGRTMDEGDGAGLTSELAASFRARAASEVLLVDFCEP